MFNFNLKKSPAYSAFKTAAFPLFSFSSFLARLFFVLLLASILSVGLSFFGLIYEATALKAVFISLFLLLIFWEISLFTRMRIMKPEITLALADALQSPGNYNLAEVLDIQACKMAALAMSVCRQKKIAQIDSAALLYAGIKESKDIQILIFRLGINAKKLQDDLKNYLEKQQRLPGAQPDFSESFQKVILDALKIASDRGKFSIGEKEILIGLAKEDQFFKKVLIEYDLKETDIENLTLWLDSIEQRVEARKKFWTRENLFLYGSLGKDWTMGFSITLDQFSIDITSRTVREIFREIIGHQKEIDETETVLAKSKMANALLIGDSGSGRMDIIDAVARKCYLGTSLPELNNKKVVQLDMIGLLTRLQDQEKVELTLDQIFQEAVAAGDIILVIDELDNFVGHNSQKLGGADISGILGKYLAMPNLQFIGTTTFDGLHRNLEQNPAFLEYFRKIEVEEVIDIETIRILQQQALLLETKHKLLILYPTIREIVNLTARYMPSEPFPKKALDLLDEVFVYAQTKKDKAVLPHHVAEVISKKTQIPVGKMETKEKETLLNLEDLIHKKIVNQAEAVKEISIAMRRARAGISNKKRPMGVFLFLGPTGVGKTETAKALSDIYFGGQGKMIRLDMSEFQAIADIPRLIGAVSPVEMQGLLTTPIRENPFSLLLLDEIEKAHLNILNLFLQVFDEGHITDGQGRKVFFSNAIIICTSNAGAPIIFKEVEAGQTVNKEKLLDTLFDQGIFKPEFVNRFDASVIFHPLTKENLLDIAELTLEGLQKNLKEKDIDFVISEPLKEKIVELAYKPEYGAREMRRVVQDNVENPIAQALLSDTIIKGDKIEMTPDFQINKIAN